MLSYPFLTKDTPTIQLTVFLSDLKLAPVEGSLGAPFLFPKGFNVMAQGVGEREEEPVMWDFCSNVVET